MFTPFLLQNYIGFQCSAEVVATNLVNKAVVFLPKGAALANELALVCTQITF